MRFKEFNPVIKEYGITGATDFINKIRQAAQSNKIANKTLDVPPDAVDRMKTDLSKAQSDTSAKNGSGELPVGGKKYDPQMDPKFSDFADAGDSEVLAKQGDKNRAVTKIQTGLTKLGYPLGKIDGDWGRRTTTAVWAFKKDFSIPTPVDQISKKDGKTIDTSTPKANPTPTTNLKATFTGPGADEARQVVDRRLGTDISDQDWEELIRTSVGEAGRRSQQERAAIIGVILNRVKSSKFPNSVKDVVYQRGQFQAVTGNKDSDTAIYNDPDGISVQLTYNAIQHHLSSVPRDWINFTSNIEAAYDGPRGLRFLKQMRDNPNNKVIGDTIFGIA